MHGGVRTHLHNRLRDEVVRLAREGLCEPEVEARPFPKDPNLRVDALFRNVNDEGRVAAVDFAVVNSVGAGHIDDATRGPGAAATSYEEVKRRKYSAAADAEGIPFIPFVFDVFGGRGASCEPLLQRIINRWGRRYDMPPHNANAIAEHRIAFVLARGVARLLLLNTAAPDEADGDE
jgi:hypothetical protein